MIRTLFIGIGVIIVALIAGSYLLPRVVEVQRSIEISRPAAEIFPHVNDLRAFHKWSPWAERDPDMSISFAGPEAGEGQSMSWQSEKDSVGSGTLTIAKSVPDERIETDLDFGDMGTGQAFFQLDPMADGSATRVTWGFATDTGMSPIGRWMGLMLDDWVGPDYAEGLAKLKAAVEGDA